MKNIKKFLAAMLTSLLFIGCSGGMGDGCCGWSAREVTGSGQVKKVSKHTPIICPDYYEVDISMGVMRDGVGSMSHHDITLYIDDKFAKDLQEAAKAGEIVDFTYDVRRIELCVNRDRLTSFEKTK